MGLFDGAGKVFYRARIGERSAEYRQKNMGPGGLSIGRGGVKGLGAGRALVGPAASAGAVISKSRQRTTEVLAAE